MILVGLRSLVALPLPLARGRRKAYPPRASALPRSCHRGNETMNRLFVASACALFLVACSKTESNTPNNPTPGAVATASQVKLELGETV